MTERGRETGGGSDLRLRLPTLLTNVTFLGALWSLVSIFVRHHDHPLVQFVDAFFGILNIPVAPGVFEAVVLVLVGISSARRKRLTIWIVLVTQVLGIVSSCLTLVQVPDLHPRDVAAYVVSVLVGLVAIPLCLWARPAFPGRIVRGSVTGALAILAVGLGLNTLFGLLLTTVGPLRARSVEATWVVARVFGPVIGDFVVDSSPIHGLRVLGLLLSATSALVTVLALLYFLRSQRLPGRTAADDLFVRGLLSQWDEDSLGYFATRDDRSVVASGDGRAAVSHGVAVGVSMAGGDPLGDPQSWDNAITQWRGECARFGWVPAALSVSEAGARAYRNQGFTVRSMGDEAVIHTNRFDINSPSMKGIAHSVRRVGRAGVQISIRRLEDIPEEERRELEEAAQRYRVGEERGFSMSLERILDPIDGRTVVVVARDATGGVQALLTFSPWGSAGVSLTLMRRAHDAVNGVVEAMVAALAEFAREHGIERISLNFAMFRRVFDEGAAVDATWNARLMRRVMLVASRFWQLDSLYESNARYQPEWVPRYFCYLTLAEIAPVIVAAGVLEGFLPQLGHRTEQTWTVTPEHLRRVREIEALVLHRTPPTRRVTEQERVRRDKARRLEAAGMEAWPPSISLGEPPSSVLAGDTGRRVGTGGRVRAVRDHGRLVFADIEREGTTLQLVLDASVLGAERGSLWRLVDIGDVVAAHGSVGTTRTGQRSVFVDSWVMAAKSLRPLPAPGTALDARTRTRERVVHFLTDPSALEVLRRRSRAFTEVRHLLEERGYLEVETPMLHPVKGGANARPFVTHLNAYGTDVFLRIAPELYLKRLAVAGMDAIFEMGRSFRNEGADNTHNPEFTSLEVYRAGGDYETMRQLTQDLFQRVAVAVNGSCVCLRPVGSPGTEGTAGSDVVHLDGVDLVPFDLSGEWPVVGVHDAISRAVGRTITPDTPIPELEELCVAHGLDLPPVLGHGELIGVLYDALVEARTVRPTFYRDFPKSTSPLTRAHRVDARLAERWDLVAFGVELGTAYTELTDPLDQRQRFTEQSLAAAAGDPEAMSIDNAFLDDLEIGLAPTGGLGLGMDRMVMLLTGSNIRQVLAFPYVRPLQGGGVR